MSVGMLFVELTRQTSPHVSSDEPTLPSRIHSESPVTPTAAAFGEARVAHVGGDVMPRASVPPDFVHRLDQSHHEQIQFLQAIAHQLSGLAHRVSYVWSRPG